MPVSEWWRLNTGCVRKALVRRSAAGISGSTPFSNVSKQGRVWPSAANTDHSRLMSSRVVVSSSVMIRYSSQALRRLMPRARARASSASVCAGVVCRHTVSNTPSSPWWVSR